MDFIFKVDPIRRNIKVPDAFTVLTMDHNIHKLVFVCPYYEDFAFDSASIVFMVDAPDGRQYIIPAEEYESFPNSPSPYVKFTLTLKSYITSVVGYMSFCITADIISSGNVIEKSWHSKNISISVGGHIDNDDSEDIPEEDVPTINQRLNNLDSKVGRLQTTVNGMANGSPTPVETIAEMTDESAVYLYTGSETGYTAGNWYYYNGSAWTSGGTYGGATTSTTFNQHGVPADDFAVGEALADKADSADVTALDTRVTAVEGDVTQSTKADVLYDGSWHTLTEFAELINGMIAANTYMPDTSKKYRVITEKEIIFPVNTHVTTGTGFRCTVIFDNNGTKTTSGWIYSDYVIPAGSLVRIQIARITETTSEVADITEFNNAVMLTAIFAEQRESSEKNILSVTTEGKNRLDIFSVFNHGILSNGEINTNYNYRACSKDLIHAISDISLHIKSGYRMQMAYFANGVYDHTSDWLTDICAINSGETVRIQIAKVTESTIEMCDIDEMLSSVYFYSPYTERFFENSTHKVAGFNNIVWENRGAGNCSLIDVDTLKVTAENTNPFYVYGRVDVTNTNTVTLYYKGWYGTGKGSLRVGVTNDSSGTSWEWINFIHTEYTILDVTAYNYIVIALYANTSAGVSGDYTIYKDLMVYNGDKILGYTRDKSALDATARGEIDAKNAKLSKNNLFMDMVHRGGYYKGTNGENRIEAIEYNCAIGGFRSMEIDVLFTSDNIPVMCHLDVNTAESGLFTLNGVAVDVTISEKTYAELQEYDYIGTKVAKFEDGLVICKKYGIEVVIDKSQNFTTNQNEIVQALLTKHSMVNSVWWTEYTTTYEPILTWNPKAKILFTVSATAWLNNNSWTSALVNYPNATFMVGFETSQITDSNIDSVIAKVPTYMYMALYTVNDYAIYKKRFNQVYCITSDYFKHGDVLNNLNR